MSFKYLSSIFKCLVVLCTCYLSLSSYAQTTGGVFGPAVKEEHRSAQYRFAYDDESERYAQRLHYQQAVNGDVMWRMVMQARKTSEQSNDFDFVQGELFWQLAPDTKSWIYGLRFDLRARDDNRPAVAGMHFTNQLKISSKTTVRGILLTAKELGDDGRDGILLSTRARLDHKFSSTVSAGVDMYSVYGLTNDLRGASDQLHQFGPYVATVFAEHWFVFGSVLLGVTEPTPDKQFRIFLGRSF